MEILLDMFASLEYFFGSVPNTSQAALVHVAYELNNLRKLSWRFHSDVMSSRFGKNSRQRSAMSKLYRPISLLSALDDIACHMFPQRIDIIDIMKVFPSAPRAEALMGKDTTIQPTCLFYNQKLVIKSTKGIYNSHTKRERPLPKRFSYANMKRLRPILLRYGKCIELIALLSKNVKTLQKYKDYLRKVLRKVAKKLKYMLEQTKMFPIIEKFRKLGLPAGHTPETLAAEHTVEEVNDMLEGHPSNISGLELEEGF